MQKGGIYSGTALDNFEDFLSYFLSLPNHIF